MSRFHTQFSRTAAPNLVFQFGEAVTFYPRGEGYGRAIQAIVDRDVRTINDEGIPALATFMSVLDSREQGVTAEEIDSGIARVEVSLRFGEKPQLRQVAKVEGTEHGLIRLQVF